MERARAGVELKLLKFRHGWQVPFFNQSARSSVGRSGERKRYSMYLFPAERPAMEGRAGVELNCYSFAMDGRHRF